MSQASDYKINDGLKSIRLQDIGTTMMPPLPLLEFLKTSLKSEPNIIHFVDLPKLCVPDWSRCVDFCSSAMLIYVCEYAVQAKNASCWMNVYRKSTQMPRKHYLRSKLCMATQGTYTRPCSIFVNKCFVMLIGNCRRMRVPCRLMRGIRLHRVKIVDILS